MSFKRGDLLQYTKEMKLLKYVPTRMDWVNKHPPISGTDRMDFTEYGLPYDQKEVIDNFYKNTRSISKSQALKMADQMNSEFTSPLKPRQTLILADGSKIETERGDVVVRGNKK